MSIMDMKKSSLEYKSSFMAYVQKIGAIVQNKDMNSLNTLYFLRFP